MREPKPGILTYKWMDFEFQGLGGTIDVTQEKFECNYGKFIAMIIPQGHNKPYAIWSDKSVVLFLNDDKYGIASITRDPDEYMFG